MGEGTLADIADLLTLVDCCRLDWRQGLVVVVIEGQIACCHWENKVLVGSDRYCSSARVCLLVFGGGLLQMLLQRLHLKMVTPQWILKTALSAFLAMSRSFWIEMMIILMSWGI